MVPASTTQSTPNRQRLRVLDACLDELELAHERDVSQLTDDLLARLGRHVPVLSPGMAITEAIDTVLREQEHCLPRQPASTPAVSGPSGRRGRGSPVHADRQHTKATPLDAAAARALTEHIKDADQRMCRLLLEAHERRAWRALGYSTWERYVKQELNMSRSRSYELLDQGRALRTIEAAAGASDVVYISTYAALQLKAHLPAVAERVRREARRVPPAQVPEVVSRIVGEFRRRAGEYQRSHVSGECSGPRADVAANLGLAIRRLASMPPVDEVVPLLEAEDEGWLRALPDAFRWLSELVIVSARLREHGTGRSRVAG